MTSVLTAESFDELHEFVRLHVAAGYASADEIVNAALDSFMDGTHDPAAVRAAAAALADQAITAHHADQAAWPERTDCDRLDAAFAELEHAGIVARQHFSCCATCGAEEIHDEIHDATREGQPPRGFTFFHIQDTEHAVAGESLYLSYGSANRDRTEALAIGQEVVETLSRHGLEPSWNGRFAHRIALPVVWQRRR
jgi:hypothetical protein